MSTPSHDGLDSNLRSGQLPPSHFRLRPLTLWKWLQRHSPGTEYRCVCTDESIDVDRKISQTGSTSRQVALNW